MVTEVLIVSGEGVNAEIAEEVEATLKLLLANRVIGVNIFPMASVLRKVATSHSIFHHLQCSQ